MKKIALFVLSIIMVFSLAACGTSSPAAPESPAPAAKETAPAPEETPTVEQAYAVVIGEYYTALE